MKIVTIVLLTLLSLSLSTAQLTCFVPGKCNEVPDSFDTAPTDVDCLNKCKADELCTWFTWYSDTICTLFTKCDEIVQDCGFNKTCVSGEKACDAPNEIQCDVPGQCQEIPIDNEIVNSADECLELVCKPNPSCEWFTFDTETNICFAYNKCDQVDTSCNTCVSGEDDCQVSSGPQCDVQGSCDSQDPFEMTVVNSVDDCLLFCQYFSRCEWFTYDTSNTICLIFDTCDEIDSSCLTCISGENECQVTSTTVTGSSSPSTSQPPQTNLPNVVVLGGYGKDRELSDVETFSLDGTPSCSKPLDLPMKSKELTAGFVNGRIMAAGGTDFTGKILNTVASLNPASGSFETMASMSEARTYHASVVTSNGWWVMGGRGPSGRIKSTEIFQNGVWMPGPIDLPVPMLGFCAVQLPDGRTFIAGGSTETEQFSSNAFIYSPGSGWAAVAAMKQGRVQHGCVYHSNQIIVAAGTGNTGALRTTESFNLATGSWTNMADLPFGLQAPDVVVSNDQVIVIGGLGSPEGYSPHFISLNINTWEIMASPKLVTPRYEHVAVMASDQALVGC